MKIALTVRQGHMLMRAANGFKVPEKVGDRAFAENVRNTLHKKFRLLYKELRVPSDIQREEKLIYFGPRDAWRRKEQSDQQKDPMAESDQKVVYEEKDPHREIEVDLSGTATDGAFWVCYLWCHAASPVCASPGFQEEVVWPIIAQIKKTRQMEEFIGLTKQEDISLKSDDEYAAEDAKAAGSNGHKTQEPAEVKT